jgi:uncharacterized protein (DUF2062 family)
MWGKRNFIRWVRYHYLRLVRLNDSPEKVALGFSIGVTVGIFPTFGLGIVIVIFLAWLTNINKASAIIGTLLMNPWTSPFFWALSFFTGSLMLGNDINETALLFKSLKTQGDLWETIIGKRLILPYIIGNITVTAVSAAVSYLAVYYLVKAYKNAKIKKALHKRGL